MNKESISKTYYCYRLYSETIKLFDNSLILKLMEQLYLGWLDIDYCVCLHLIVNGLPLIPTLLPFPRCSGPYFPCYVGIKNCNFALSSSELSSSISFLTCWIPIKYYFFFSSSCPVHIHCRFFTVSVTSFTLARFLRVVLLIRFILLLLSMLISMAFWQTSSF